MENQNIIFFKKKYVN